MPKNSDASNVSRRRFLTVAGSVAAASSLARGNDVGSAQPPPTTVTPVHYLVTMNVTSSGPILYTAENKDTSTPVSMTNNSLTVNNGDEVKWQAITVGPNAKYRAHIRFPTTTPFAVQEFKWSENGFGGGTTQNVGTHYYCVGIFDKVKQEIYADDPRIIVGGTGATAEVAQAKRELTEVQEKIGSVEDILKKAIEKLEERH